MPETQYFLIRYNYGMEQPKAANSRETSSNYTNLQVQLEATDLAVIASKSTPDEWLKRMTAAAQYGYKHPDDVIRELPDLGSDINRFARRNPEVGPVLLKFVNTGQRLHFRK